MYLYSPSMVPMSIHTPRSAREILSSSIRNNSLSGTTVTIEEIMSGDMKNVRDVLKQASEQDLKELAINMLNKYKDEQQQGGYISMSHLPCI